MDLFISRKLNSSKITLLKRKFQLKKINLLSFLLLLLLKLQLTNQPMVLLLLLLPQLLKLSHLLNMKLNSRRRLVTLISILNS